MHDYRVGQEDHGVEKSNDLNITTFLLIKFDNFFVCWLPLARDNFNYLEYTWSIVIRSNIAVKQKIFSLSF